MKRVNSKLAAFSPGNLKPKDLEALLVSRQKEIALLVNSILSAGKNRSAPPQHLIVAPRGYGKTHLVNIVFNRLISNKANSKDYVLAFFKEEEHVHSYLDFLRRVLIAISQNYPSQDLKREIDSIYGDPSPSRVNEIEGFFKKFLEGRLLVIILENFGDILDGIEMQGQRRLRSFIQEVPQISLIGTAQKLFDPLESKDFPLFGFFQKIYLKPFSNKETNHLLGKLAEFSEDTELSKYLETDLGKSRVRAVKELTSGNPRLITLLSSFLNREKLDDLTGAFMELIETSLTPYYQEQMARLSPLQKRIVEILCAKGDGKPLTVKQFARRALTTSQSISVQLRRMEELGILYSRKKGKFTFYGMSEPLWRVSIEVKNNREGILPIVVQFLKIVNSPHELFYQASRIGGAMNSIQKCISHAYRESFDSLKKPEKERFLDSKIKELCEELPENPKNAEKIARVLSETLSEEWVPALIVVFKILRGVLDSKDIERRFGGNEEDIIVFTICESWDQFPKKQLDEQKAYLSYLKFIIYIFKFNKINTSILKNVYFSDKESVGFVAWTFLFFDEVSLATKWLLKYSKEDKRLDIFEGAIRDLVGQSLDEEKNILKAVLEVLRKVKIEYFNLPRVVPLLGEVFVLSGICDKVDLFFEIFQKRIPINIQRLWFFMLSVMIISDQKETVKVWENQKTFIFDFCSKHEHLEGIENLLLNVEAFSKGDDEAIADFPLEIRKVFEKAKKKREEKNKK